MIIPANIKAIIFDLDDTLLIDDAAAEAAFLKAAKSLEIVDANEVAKAASRISKEVWETSPVRQLTKKIGHSAWEGMWAEYDEGNELFKPISDWQTTFQNLTWNKVLEEFAIVDQAQAGKLADVYVEERRKLQTLYEGVPEILEGLKKDYKLALLTNGIPRTQWIKIDAAGLEPYFDVIVVSGEVGVGKPDPKVFEVTLERLGVPKDEAIMIGNNPDTDIKGAENTGIQSILIKDGEDLRMTE